MPPKTKVEKNDVCDEPCVFHDGKIIKYYCAQHQEVCCSVCATLNHRSCDNVSYIPDIAKGTKKSKEFSGLVKNLKLMTNQFEKIRNENEREIQVLLKYREDFERSVQALRQQINIQLDKMTKNVLMEMDKVCGKESRKKKAKADSYGQFIEQLQVASAEIQKNTIEGECKLFVSLKKHAKLIMELEALQVEKERKEPRIERFEFEVDAKLRETMQSLESLGRVKLLTRKGNESTESLASLPARSSTRATIQLASSLSSIPSSRGEHIYPERKAEYVRNLHPKSDDDTANSDITGITMLEDGRAVYADFRNKNLKLTDTDLNCVSQFSMTFAPWDVTTLIRDQIVVTTPDDHKLQFFIVGPVLMSNKTVPTKSKCYGIAYNQEFLVVTCPMDIPPSVKLLTSEGKMVRQISLGSRCERLFKTPLFVTIGLHDLIYVSDSKFNTVTSLSADLRSVEAVYRDANLKHPRGLATDRDGNVYVSGQWFHNMYVISSESNRLLQFLVRDDGLTKPQALAYNEKMDQLLVSMTDLNLLKLFQLAERHH